MAPSEQNKSKSVFISLPNYTEYEVPHSLRAGLGSGNGSAGESLAGEYQGENSSAAIRPPACTWLCARSLLHFSTGLHAVLVVRGAHWRRHARECPPVLHYMPPVCNTPDDKAVSEVV